MVGARRGLNRISRRVNLWSRAKVFCGLYPWPLILVGLCGVSLQLGSLAGTAALQGRITDNFGRPVQGSTVTLFSQTLGSVKTFV